MKLEPPVNPNYAATIVVVRSLRELPKLDRVVGAPFLGFQAIVGKDTQVGDIGVLFSAETQLSEEYAYQNNLHRHGDRNIDEGAKGYLEDSRRVKAMKFQGNQSDALYMPLSSLAYTGVNLDDLNPGDTFDKLGGHDICKKYLVKQPGVMRIDKNASKTFKRVESKFMPEHYDTDNYWRNADAIAPDAQIVVTQKLHGTSIRIGNTIVRVQLNRREKLARKFFGVRVSETEYDMVYGSRKVVKDVNNPNQNHFYTTDLWSEVGHDYDQKVPQNYIVYGEVVGYTSDGGLIQKGYTYDLEKGHHELFVYRVAVITNQGRLIDLTWDAVVDFCEDNGFEHVPELWRGRHKDFDVDQFIDARFNPYYPQAIALSDPKSVDEGVVVRAEGRGGTPYLLKAKSPIFLQHESLMLDEEAVDLEAEESL